MRDRLVGTAGERQREAAVVAEAIEQAAARVQRRGRAVLALVEKQPGLLTVPQVDLVLDADSRTGTASGTSPASTSTFCSSPSSSRVRGSLRARMPRGRSCSLRIRDDERQQRSIPLRQRLHDQVVAVAIDDERRQEIGFAVHQPVRRRIDAAAPGAERDRRRDSAPRCSASSATDVPVGQHAQRDLRSIAVQAPGRASGRAGSAPSRDRRRGLDLDDVGAIDPRVAGLEPLLAARRNDDDGMCVILTMSVPGSGFWVRVRGSGSVTFEPTALRQP